MSLRITPYLPEHEDGVAGLNARLAARGVAWGFYRKAVPNWLPPTERGPAETVWQDYYVVTDDQACRGGFVLKPQIFRHEGADIRLTSWQGPVSEGLIDKAYVSVGMLCLREMAQRSENLFCWGGSAKLLPLVEAFGWHRADTNWQIAVVNGGRFARHARILRQRPAVAWLMDLMSRTGLASAAATAWAALRQIGCAQPGLRAVSTEALDERADALWSAVRDQYGTIAQRDAATANRLLKQDGWPDARIFNVFRDGRFIGWGALRLSQKSDDPRFGDMRVGTLLDALSEPGEERAVLSALTQSLRSQDVDLIATYMTHDVWRSGLERLGFFELKHRRAFCATPQMAQAVGGDLPGFLSRAHLTPIDADGPHGI